MCKLSVYSRRLQASCFSSLSTSMPSSVKATANLWLRLFSRPTFLSNCLTDKVRHTGPVLPMLLYRMHNFYSSCLRFTKKSQHTRFLCILASFDIFPSLPNTCRLISCVFLEESRLSFKVKGGIYNWETLFYLRLANACVRKTLTKFFILIWLTLQKIWYVTPDWTYSTDQTSFPVPTVRNLKVE